MRVFVFISFVAALICGSTPALAAWETYVFEDLGVVKDFPAEPQRSETSYTRPVFMTRASEPAEPAADSGAVDNGIGPQPFAERGIEAVDGNAPAVLFEVEVENIIYRMTVVDVQDQVAHSASIMLECINIYEEAGELLSNISARTRGDSAPSARVWGREVTVDLPDNGGRIVGACYFTKGNLYRVEAHVLPEHGDLNDTAALRFTNTLDFRVNRDLEQEEAEALAAYEYFLEHGVYPQEGN